MGYFKTSETFQEMLSGFFKLIAETPAIADKLIASNLIIRFKYSDPDVVLLIDCSGENLIIKAADEELKVDVEMTMSADIAHKFWFGKVNLMTALTRKQMVAKGPIPKILQLLPAIKPTYKMYPEYLRENGYAEYIVF